MRCPYCHSANVWLIEIIGIIERWYCKYCQEEWEIRHTEKCGKKTFHYGDNFPNFKQEREQYKDIPPIRKEEFTDLIIDLWELINRKEKSK